MTTVESGFSIEDLFTELEGRDFQGEYEFRDAVIEGFNENLGYFPPDYSYLDAITWAHRQGWLTVEGSTIHVVIPGTEAA